MFDWCNQWALTKTDTTNFTVNAAEWQQFISFAAKQSTLVMAENWKKSLGKSEIYPSQLKPFETIEIKNNIVKDLEANKSSIQYKLISEIMQRKLSRTSYLQQYLNLDSELKQAQDILLNPDKYNKILKP